MIITLSALLALFLLAYLLCRSYLIQIRFELSTLLFALSCIVFLVLVVLLVTRLYAFIL